MDAEDDHQTQQGQHHELRDFFHAVLDAAAADRKAQHDVDSHPDHHEFGIAQHTAEHAAHFICSHAGCKAAGEEFPKVAEHPAGYGSVVHHQQVVAYHAKPAVDVPFGARFFQRFVASDHALAAAPADRQLHGHDGDAHNDEEDEIPDDEDTAAVRPCYVGEFPNVSDADGAARAHQQETKSRFKTLSVVHTYYR